MGSCHSMGIELVIQDGKFQKCALKHCASS